MTKLSVRVRSRAEQANGIASFDLVSADGSTLPSFTAGAHIDVHVAPGLIRQYSLCNDPVERGFYRIAVLREPQSRGGSAGMHAQVEAGTTLTISEPRNQFPLAANASRSLLLAGGIGITPILAMAQTLHAQGAPFDLHYCGRSATRMAFIEELKASAFASSVQVHCDDDLAELRFDAARVLANPQPDVHLYVCGPSGFMEFVLASARAAGWQENQLHREYFAAAAVDTSGDGAFRIQLAKLGLQCEVPPDKTVLEVLLAQGVDLPHSCEAGVCGTCLTRVLEGQPDHRDSFLTDAEKAAGNQFMPCCSRARSSLLVLDI
jgi:vanillate monooxygenase ferredoxin subunit